MSLFIKYFSALSQAFRISCIPIRAKRLRQYFILSSSYSAYPQQFYNSVIVAIYVGDIENHWLLMENVGCDVNRSIAWITHPSHYYRYAFFPSFQLIHHFIHSNCHWFIFITYPVAQLFLHARIFVCIRYLYFPLRYTMIYTPIHFAKAKKNLFSQQYFHFIVSFASVSLHICMNRLQFFVSYFPWKCKICKVCVRSV